MTAQREAGGLVVVTGASSGIGAALAERLARPGASLGLVGRNAEGLVATAAAVERRGAEALVGCFDLREGAFAPWLRAVSRDRRLMGLYANAGVSAGPPSPAALEGATDTERLIATNLSATVGTVREAVEVMRLQPMAPQPVRRIALVASIAALFPIADLAVYSATKAALVAYGHALRPRLAAEGIRVSVVCPGFVTTPMSARHRGPKPFEMGAEEAAAAIVRAVERGARTAVMPWPFAVASYLAPLAPGVLLDAIFASFAADIAPDRRGGASPAAGEGGAAPRTPRSDG